MSNPKLHAPNPNALPTSTSQKKLQAQIPKRWVFLGMWDLGVRCDLELGAWDLASLQQLGEPSVTGAADRQS
jgi:hypothetical protein